MILLDRPWVIGHRGFPSRAMENTLPSFEAALAAGAAGVECDVRATRDGRVVCFHDASTYRLLGTPGRIEAMHSEEIRSREFPRGEPQTRIPELDDVLVLAEERDALILVELKGDPLVGMDFARAVVASVERTRTEDRTAFLSFSHAAVALLREMAPSIPSAPIFEKTPHLDEIGAGAWPPWVVTAASAATPELCAELRRRGTAMACYGVDDEATDARLDAMGVGCRISNAPDLLAARRRTA